MLGRSEVSMDWPPTRDVHVRPVRGFRRADQVLGVGRRHLGRRPIPGHAGKGDGAVPADLRCPVLGVRAGDALYAGHLGHLGQRRGHRGPHRGGLDGGAVRGLDHDLVALTGGGREVLCQKSGGRLRIGTRQAEVGVETAADGHADPGDDDDGQQPDGHHPLAVLEAPATQSGHGNLHGRMCGNVPRTQDPMVPAGRAWRRGPAGSIWRRPRWCTAQARGSRTTPAGVPRDHPAGV